MKNAITNIYLFFQRMMTDATKSGETSSKRFVGLVGFFMLCIALILNMILKVEPAAILVEAIMYIVIAALFGTSLDKIMSPRQQSIEENEPKI